MKSRRSIDTNLSPELLEYLSDSSDESYSDPHEGNRYTCRKKYVRKAPKFTRESIPWFSGAMSMAEASTSTANRFRRGMEDMHPFLKRSDSCFHVEWCETLKKFFYTDSFENLLDGMEMPAKESPKEVDIKVAHKQGTFSLAVDLDRFKKFAKPEKVSVQQEPIQSDEQSLTESQSHNQKMNTAEAALATWKSLKKANPDMEEEIEDHYKGKNVYLEQVKFLEEAEKKQSEVSYQMQLDAKAKGK